MIGPSSSAAELVAFLQSRRSEETIAGMAGFGIATATALGLSNPDLRKVAEWSGKPSTPDCILGEQYPRSPAAGACTAHPKQLTIDEAELWYKDLLLGIRRPRGGWPRRRRSAGVEADATICRWRP